MKITYDSKADALYIQFPEGSVCNAKKIGDGILIDVDKEGRLFGLEIIGVSERMPVEALGHFSLALPIAQQ